MRREHLSNNKSEIKPEDWCEAILPFQAVTQPNYGSAQPLARTPRESTTPLTLSSTVSSSFGSIWSPSARRPLGPQSYPFYGTMAAPTAPVVAMPRQPRVLSGRSNTLGARPPLVRVGKGSRTQPDLTDTMFSPSSFASPTSSLDESRQPLRPASQLQGYGTAVKQADTVSPRLPVLLGRRRTTSALAANSLFKPVLARSSSAPEQDEGLRFSPIVSP